jgi:MscS family membrane protein
MNEIMDTIFLNNRVSVWLAALLSIACGCAAGILAALAGSRLLRPVFTRHKGGTLESLFRKPVALFFVYAGFKTGLSRLVFSEVWEHWEARVLDSLFAVIICWCLAKLIDACIVQLFQVKTEAPPSAAPPLPASFTEIQPHLRKLASIVMFVIPASLVLKIMGYNISALLAGLGIGGAAIAFAAKDTLANFFGTATVFVDKSFKLNDRIKVAGFDGFVMEIRLRSCRIKTLDNRIVTIPNSFFQNNPVENVSSEPHTKITQTIVIHADNGAEKARQAVEILRTVRVPGQRDWDSPPTGSPPAGSSPAGSAAGIPYAALGCAPAAALSAIGLRVFKITFIFFVAKGADYWETINAVNTEVLTRFTEAGILFVQQPSRM